VDIHSAINLEALKRAAPALYEVLTNSSTTSSSQPSSTSPALLAKLRAIKRAHPSVIETLNRHLRPTNVSSYSPAGTAFSTLGLPQHILSDEEQLALRLNPDAVALALDLLGSEIAPTNIQQETQAHDDSPHQDNEEKR
jgi:hypothetical protein